MYTGTKPHFRTRLHCIPESCLLSTAVPKSLKRQTHPYSYPHTCIPPDLQEEWKRNWKEIWIKGSEELGQSMNFAKRAKKAGGGGGEWGMGGR